MSLHGYKPKWKKVGYLGPAAKMRASLEATAKLERIARAKASTGAPKPSPRRFVSKTRPTGSPADKNAPKVPKTLRRIRPVSRRRQKITAEYRQAAREFVKQAMMRGTCPVVANIPELRDGFKYGWPTCSRINEVHHMRGRSGSLLTDQRFWMAVSKAGHKWLHSNIAEARKRGWICEVGDWNRPVDV